MSCLTALSLVLSLGGAASAQSIAGSYLAARSAAMHYDFQEAATYFTRALARDRGNVELMENALVAQVSLGRVEKALPIARSMQEAGVDSQSAALVVIADRVQRGAFDELLQADPAELTQQLSTQRDGG